MSIPVGIKTFLHFYSLKGALVKSPLPMIRGAAPQYIHSHKHEKDDHKPNAPPSLPHHLKTQQ